MAQFIYQVRDEFGNIDSGVVSANSLSEAAETVRAGGKVILSIRPESGTGGGIFPANKRIKRDQVIYLTTQLAVMVDTGVPLTEALDVIAEQTDHSGLKALLTDVAGRVKSGTEFSAALAEYPRVFDRLLIAMMHASEASGTMGQMLQRASEYMEREREIRKRIKGAMTYPVCMMVFCVLIVVGLLIFVLPRFEKIYANKGAILPLPTRLLLSASSLLVDYWPAMLLGVAVAVTAAVMYLRSPAGRIMLDRIRLKMPVLGTMYRKAYLARSMRTLATMISSGVNMLDGLEITAQVAGNHFYASLWREVGQRVKEGSTVCEPLFEADLVPKPISQMISAGERTGRLGAVLDRIARFCEEDLKVGVKTVTQLIEPAMIVVMGLIIGGIALALLLPVFSISRVVAH